MKKSLSDVEWLIAYVFFVGALTIGFLSWKLSEGAHDESFLRQDKRREKRGEGVEEKVLVHIEGEVEKPGTYEMERGIGVKEILQFARMKESGEVSKRMQREGVYCDTSLYVARREAIEAIEADEKRVCEAGEGESLE